MGDPRFQANLPAFKISDDATKIRTGRVTTTENGQFTPVKIWIVKAYVALKESHKDQPPTKGHVVEGGTHRVRITRSVKDCSGQIISNKAWQVRQCFVAIVQTGSSWMHAPTKSQPLLADIHDDNLCPRQQSKLCDRQSYRTRSQYQYLLPFCQLRTRDRVRPNRERFDERELLIGQCLRRVQFGSRHNGILAHAPVDMHSKYLEIDATIRLAPPTGRTMPTIEIRFYRTVRSHCQILPLLCSQFHNLDPKLVPQYARIAKKRLLTAKGVKVRPTHSHLANADQGLARPGSNFHFFLLNTP